MRRSCVAALFFAVILAHLTTACSGQGGGTNPPPGQLVVSTTSLPDGQVNMPYSATLAATGGSAPYTWAKSSGQLPAGLNPIASTGAITGTPTTAGKVSFGVTVTDHTGAPASASLSINIVPSGGGSQITLNSVQMCALPGTPLLCTLSPHTAGNLIVVAFIGTPGEIIHSITDNQGNVYVDSGVHGSFGDSGESYVWYAKNAAAGVSNITFSLSKQQSDSAEIYDVSNASSSPLDAMSTAGGSDAGSGTVSGPSITPTTAGGLVIAEVGVANLGLTGVNSPFTFDPQDQNNGWAHVAGNSVQTYTPSWIRGAALGAWGAAAVTFKAAGH
jgi:Putative Ig domain